MRTFGTLTLTGACLLALTAMAGAQCYGTPYYPTYSYPTVQYQTVYQKEYVPIAVAIPFQAIIPVSGYSYAGAVQAGYPLAPTLQAAAPQANASSACDTKIAELKADFSRQIAELRLARFEQREEGPPRARASEGGAVGVLRAQCASCHSGAKSKGGVQIFLDNGSLNPRVDRARLHDAADKGRMPPAAQQNVEAALSDEDVDTLKAWVR